MVRVLDRRAKMWSSVIHPAVTPEVRSAIWKARLGSDDPSLHAPGAVSPVETEPRPGAVRTGITLTFPPYSNRISSAGLGSQTITPRQ